MLAGHVLNFVEGHDTALADLREVQPALLIASVKVWAELRSATSLAILAATPLERRAYRWAFSLGRQIDSLHASRLQASAFRRVAWYVARRLVLGNLRRMMGLERTRFALAGAAPCSTGLLDWFRAMGVPVREFWGMAEASGIGAIGEREAGTLSQPLPGLRLQRAADGELTLTQRTCAARATLLTTGDLVQKGVSGCLHLLGRRSEIFALESGRGVVPMAFERRLGDSEFIDGALLVGAGRPFCVSLVSINSEAVRHWAQKQGVRFTNFASLVNSEAVRGLIAGEVAEANAAVAPHMRARSFSIFHDVFRPADEEMTAIGTFRRTLILERYASLIADLYAATEP
jgi:long-chain acyl-CoA synthetase